MIRSLALAGTAVLALGTAAAAQTPAPQNASPDTNPPAATAATAAPDDGGEIIVTAQKRSERLQDVPVAVSVVSGATIDSLGRTSLEGAQYLVPALNFVKAGTALNQTLFLRGIGTTTFSIAVEPSVSTVLDGVVLSRAAEAFTDLVDIERIEVLRGPQGTLFGKNASAGVINIVSKRPGDKLGGYVEGSYFFDNGAEYRVRGALDVPLSQNVRTRTTAFYDKYDGNIFNQAPNVDHRVNGFKHYGVRSILEADASDRVKLTFIGDYHHNNDECCADIIGGPPLTGTGAVNTTALNLIQTVLPTLNGDKTRRIDQNLITRTIETGYGFSGQADVELGPMTVTSITAYRNFKNNEIRDGDFYPQAYIGAQQVHDIGPQTGHTFTQELRLTSPSHQMFTYVAGFFYSNTYTRRIFERDDIICAAAAGAVLPAGVLTPCTSPLAGPSTFASGIADYSAIARNVALFGQGTLNVATRFRLIGGVRYTIDQLDTTFIRRVPVAGASNPPFDAGVFASAVLFPPNGTPAAANGVPLHLKATSDNFSGKAGAQFDVTENSTAYASYTRGYKGPAFNLFFNLQANGTNTIAPETSNSFEIGLKNTLLGGKLTVNLAAYYAKYFNFQANSPDTLTIGGFTQTIARFTNAGTVSTRGGEVDIVYRPLRDLSISGGAAYSDAHVDRFKLPVGGTVSAVIPNGTPLAFAPKWKASLAADYRIRTNSLPVDFALGAQGSYQSSQLSLFVADPIQRANGTIHAYGLVNLSASVLDKDDRYKLTFQVRNLTNESFAAAIATGGPSGAYRYQIPRDADRYFGVTGRVNF